MKTIIQVILVGLVLVVIVLLFYFYFPEIWGEAIYPLAYREDILNAVDQENATGSPHQLEPTLVAAVIFTESRFNPAARSRAGAVGLGQLLPSTADQLASELNIQDYSRGRLIEPGLNIRLMVRYLANSYRRHGGNKEFVLANYNYGPRGPALLLVSGGDRSVLPLETQGFIRKVLTAESFYRSIYGPRLVEGPQKPFVTPQESFISKLTIKNLFGFVFE